MLARVDVPIAAVNFDREATTVDAWQRYAAYFKVHVLPGVTHLDTIWERFDEFDEALVNFVEAFQEREDK